MIKAENSCLQKQRLLKKEKFTRTRILAIGIRMTTDYGLVILAEKSPIIILLMYTLNMGLLLRLRWLGARLKEFLKDTASSHSLILLILRLLLQKPMANLSEKDLW